MKFRMWADGICDSGIAIPSDVIQSDVCMPEDCCQRHRRTHAGDGGEEDFYATEAHRSVRLAAPRSCGQQLPDAVWRRSGPGRHWRSNSFAGAGGVRAPIPAEGRRLPRTYLAAPSWKAPRSPVETQVDGSVGAAIGTELLQHVFIELIPRISGFAPARCESDFAAHVLPFLVASITLRTSPLPLRRLKSGTGPKTSGKP
jgi:hypothetical protein